ncbi:tripartite tricarboxylate transporter TctB family protein [Bradyrhizobium sp. GCM10027634]|uniref:tripartite tricarboxylate transporter TctB family protein n=1 Tax=unclassified Bradyrhizobium TaxID=2631580 RepID=UPI00188BB176|nr:MULTISPECIES: tripartite tricarboxylate transporter TctB family protein [unclassified Bradyrhizobium]MDN5002022.1 tripartite tricarboxylate transporter TctB family protein [Bradyrhizobium sp. WYCCWR 12677]QOZ45703.1 tripartite tricarboxylate transporter TctB family protein [Bradyrhizobium sp. CCBAU 53340]
MISRRVLELATAVLTGSFGVAVVVQSLDNGIGWSSEGVESGTFPFLTGLIIVAGSLYNLARGVVPTASLASVPVAITSIELRRLAGLFLPAAIFVAAIPLLGMYVASAGYIFAVLAIPRHQAMVRSAGTAAVTALALYVVFERMFQVSLPHGALAAALGF